MPGVVADTHTIVCYLSRDSRLSWGAHAALTAATTDGDLIHIPSICLVELTYLAEKGRLPGARLLMDVIDLGHAERLLTNSQHLGEIAPE